MINKVNKAPYNYLTYFVAIYTFFFMLPDFLLKKIVVVPYLGMVPMDIFFTGVYFVILDVVTEVYGYYQARKVLYAGLVAYTCFIIIMELTVNVPTATNYLLGADHNIDVYTYLFNHIYTVWLSVVICCLVANTLNMLILSKWKVLVKGRLFWFRSIVTSLVAALVYSFVSNLMAVGVILHPSHISYIFTVSLLSLSAKLITLLICAFPANILCNWLKKVECDVYDHNIRICKSLDLI